MTAEKFGQASNDPRVVRSQQVQATQQPPVAEPAVVSASTIRGTVGDFVRKALADAESRLKNDGVISCFIAAIDAHTQQAKSANKSANIETSVTPTADTNVEDSNFDFSNYGYQPLAADYLTRFETMTQAVSQFAATQGKTDVEPRAIGKRAGNDPRGQHPSYQEPAVLSLPTEQAADTEQAVIEHDDNNVDAHDVEANALANQAQANNISAHSEQLLEADQALVEATDEPSNEGTVIVEHVAAEKTDGAHDDSEAADIEEANTQEADVEKTKPADEPKVEQPINTKEAGKDDSQAAKSKTTIASYKNMIENVAEQLLPQTGMFNLTTPKVPKARSRKPKTEHKKPTQAEKLEADDSDSES